MFRRLAEGFSEETDFITSEQQLFNVLPSIIPSATSGLPGLDNALRTVAERDSSRYQAQAITTPNQTARPFISPSLKKQAAACATGSIDDLIHAKDTSNRIGCGWVYTPPGPNSPYPVISRGALGNVNGPSAAFDPSSHKKWFFNLQEAKRRALIDKCKALKACTDVDSAVFNGVCGFCTDTNQGVPVDTVGKALYNDTCSVVITDKGKCPPPPTDRPINRICDPVNGRLSMDCLQQTVKDGGCNGSGALAIALQSGDRAVDTLMNSNSVQIYNRVANPPLNMRLFKDGTTTVMNVLQEVRQLAKNAATELETSGIGAAARDLCLKRGTINKYNPCLELTDTTTPPFDMKCLQELFLKAGGTKRGRIYPSEATMKNYNSMNTLGRVKQYWAGLLMKMKGNGVNYQEQSDALEEMIGVKPEDMITRAPYEQGVEVFWFVPAAGVPNKVNGFLRRTIERKIVQFEPGPSNVPQIGTGYGCMLQLTDLRTPSDFSARFDVTVDDGFWIAVNQPATIDEIAMSQPGRTIDKPGLFENLGLQGTTRYVSSECTPFRSTTPNIMKLFHEDAGGGWAAFTFNINACAGTPVLDAQYLSLTCEKRAPFLSFEVSSRGRWEEIRNPGLFAQFTPLVGIDYHTRTDEKSSVPGKKSFVRLNAANSLIDLRNIAFQSWKNMTIALRFNNEPIKESIINLACGPVGSCFFNVIAIPESGDIAKIHIEYRLSSGIKHIITPFAIRQGLWYLFRIKNDGKGFSLYCDTISDLIATKGAHSSVITVAENKPLWGVNGTWNPAPGQAYEAANVMLGTAKYRTLWHAMHGSGSFSYDVAWVHFFDNEVTNNDMFRDATADWVYTQFPKAYDTYR
jgi:hypothetical protein